MPHHHTIQRHSAYTTEQLFALIADVRAYPEFLPWVTAARILSESETEMVAELAVRFKGFGDSYTSRVSLEPPAGPDGPGAISVTLSEEQSRKGPFRRLSNEWRFEPLDDPADPGKRSIIRFAIEFAFRSDTLDRLIGGMFARAVLKMSDAFEERAKALYGGT